MAITIRGDKPPAGVAILFAKSSANISQPTTELSDSGYATNARPGSANYNWLFNYVSAGVTHCFVYGIPVYDPAETYTATSFINRNGILYKSLQGSNTGNLPETAGSTYWHDTRASRTQTISASGSLVLGGYNWEIAVDLSVGPITISQLPVPDFIGQRLHIYGTGTYTGKITGGTGLYANGVYFTADTGGVWLTAVSATEWRAENTITAVVAYSNWIVYYYAEGSCNIIGTDDVTTYKTTNALGSIYYAQHTFSYPVTLATAPIDIIDISKNISYVTYPGNFLNALTGSHAARLCGINTDSSGVFYTHVNGLYV